MITARCGSGLLFLVIGNKEHLGTVPKCTEEASSPVSPQAEGGSARNWRQGLVVTQQPPDFHPQPLKESGRKPRVTVRVPLDQRSISPSSTASDLDLKSAFFHSNEILF